MTKPVGEAPSKSQKKEEKKFDTSSYSCEVIFEKTTKEKADDRQLPTDAFNVYYTVAVSYTHLTLPTKRIV